MRDTCNNANEFFVMHNVTEGSNLRGGLNSGVDIFRAEVSERIAFAILEHIFNAFVERDHEALITPAEISFVTSVSYSALS